MRDDRRVDIFEIAVAHQIGPAHQLLFRRTDGKHHSSRKLECSIAFFTAWAAPTATAAMTLCPSMWPGAPSTSGLRGMLPGVCEPSGKESISVAMAIIGLPDPHLAQTLVGNPAPPTSTV